MSKNKSTNKTKEPKYYFFIVTSKALFIKEDTPRERTVNTLLRMNDPMINASGLREINRAAISRIVQESQVEADKIVDVIILSIAPLGYMTDSEWSQEQDLQPETKEVQEEDQKKETIQ